MVFCPSTWDKGPWTKIMSQNKYCLLLSCLCQAFFHTKIMNINAFLKSMCYLNFRYHDLLNIHILKYGIQSSKLKIVKCLSETYIKHVSCNWRFCALYVLRDVEVKWFSGREVKGKLTLMLEAFVRGEFTEQCDSNPPLTAISHWQDLATKASEYLQ
jgi:hypothetical protein